MWVWAKPTAFSRGAFRVVAPKCYRQYDWICRRKMQKTELRTEARLCLLYTTSQNFPSGKFLGAWGSLWLPVACDLPFFQKGFTKNRAPASVERTDRRRELAGVSFRLCRNKKVCSPNKIGEQRLINLIKLKN